MKSLILAFISISLLFSLAQAQKVGLVLSGGGAKGLTHIGIIRALEENNIPIDYITGTSMGAIIGSLYAMGYSPDEMETLLKAGIQAKLNKNMYTILRRTSLPPILSVSAYLYKNK